MLFVEEIIDIKFQRIQGIFQCGRLRAKKAFQVTISYRKKVIEFEWSEHLRRMWIFIYFATIVNCTEKLGGPRWEKKSLLKDVTWHLIA